MQLLVAVNQRNVNRHCQLAYQVAHLRVVMFQSTVAFFNLLDVKQSYKDKYHCLISMHFNFSEVYHLFVCL